MALDLGKLARLQLNSTLWSYYQILMAAADKSGNSGWPVADKAQFEADVMANWDTTNNAPGAATPMRSSIFYPSPDEAPYADQGDSLVR
jgi:hypothetical protein